MSEEHSKRPLDKEAQDNTSHPSKKARIGVPATDTSTKSSNNSKSKSGMSAAEQNETQETKETTAEEDLAQTQEQLSALIRQFFTQLTIGCGKRNCANTKCASNIENNPWPANTAAAMALSYARDKTRHSLLCNDTNVFDMTTGEEMVQLAQKWRAKSDDVECRRALIRRIGTIFGRWQCLALTFRDDKNRVDTAKLAEFYKLIPRTDDVQNILQSTIGRMLGELTIVSMNLKDGALENAMSVLLMLSQQPFSELDDAALLLLCRSIFKLKENGKTTMYNHWEKQTSEWLHGFVELLNQALNVQIMRQMESSNPIPLHRLPDVVGIVTTLRILFELNDKFQQEAVAVSALTAPQYCFDNGDSTASTSAKTEASTSTASTATKKKSTDMIVDKSPAPAVSKKTPFATYKQFQCELLREHIDLVENFRAWVSNSGFSFVEQSHVLTTDLKAKVVHIQSLVSQRQHRVEARALIGARPTLSLTLKRERIVEDTFEQLQRVPARDLRKELRITFEQEEAIDEGGVRKEWFQLLVAEIFDPKYGMFLLNEKTRTFWFRSDSQERLYYNLMGSLLGMAIYNGVILDLHFPNVVYKLLLGVPPVFEDLGDVDAELYKGLQQLLEFDGDVEDVFERTFSIEYEVFGEKRVAELKPNGANIALTNDNKLEYTRLYAKYVLLDAVQEQWAAFKRGFDLVCDKKTMKHFDWQELELIICGSSTLDFDELEKGAVYSDKYSAEHPTIQRFWRAVHALSFEDKKKLLHFATGSDRAPIGGLRNLHLVLVYQPDSDRLPTSHTCFNQLLLPDYQTDEKMVQSLSVAISNAQGFGML